MLTTLLNLQDGCVRRAGFQQTRGRPLSHNQTHHRLPPHPRASIKKYISTFPWTISTSDFETPLWLIFPSGNFWGRFFPPSSVDEWSGRNTFPSKFSFIAGVVSERQIEYRISRNLITRTGSTSCFVPPSLPPLPHHLFPVVLRHLRLPASAVVSKTLFISSPSPSFLPLLLLLFSYPI